MAELQRSAMSFRRQGSSGQVFDDKFLKELDKITKQQGEEQQEDKIKPTISVGPIQTIDRSISNGGGRAFCTGKVSPAIEPPSPRISACGFCSAFGMREKKGRRKSKSRKPRI